MGTGVSWGAGQLFNGQQEASCCARIGDLWTASSFQEETHARTHKPTGTCTFRHTGGHLTSVHTRNASPLTLTPAGEEMTGSIPEV